MKSGSKSPSYYVKKRFLKNRVAVVGLAVIAMITIVALMGYWIMPDATENANIRLPELKKQGPGFEVQMLKIRRNREVEERGFLEVWWSGREQKYTYRPLSDWRFNEDSTKVIIDVFEGGQSFKTESYHIADIVYDIGDAGLLKSKGTGVFWKTSNGKNEHQDLAKIRGLALGNLITKTYVIGTDVNGRDMMSKLIFGSRISLAIGLISVLISVFIGVFLGALAGYFGGWIDQIIQWVMTVIWSVPRIMLVIAISIGLQSTGIWTAFLAVGLTMWVEVARVIRGQVLEAKGRQYVEAARAYGASELRVIFRHILPNVFGPLVVVFTANFADAILIEAGLSFLGLGVQPPMPSWGQMVQEGFSVITSPGLGYLILYPAMAISLLVLSFNLLGNGLRDAFDPKSDS